MSIQKIWAREILDSRGNPTVEVDLHTAKGDEERGLSVAPTSPTLGLERVEVFLQIQAWGARSGSQGWFVESDPPWLVDPG